ncbi:Uracil DNA glycosylase superfamily protein [Candidatus Fokinia solitaria]|uniref:Type-4 uracil-DNA glycosylase n=1 Tax=Candidatus Fokinia solitaria TaxID=1802984 RepID=A0A2U8BRW4_9RICK|nr:uracil-DNA glycosylase [Candidatus Fokinia solitaria]AWD33096.1 Uracil DNA glycosylase superfamily protein [Candidatus Fokinia solitaria]
MANNIRYTKAMLAIICVQLHKAINSAIHDNFQFLETESIERMNEIILFFQKLEIEKIEKIENRKEMTNAFSSQSPDNTVMDKVNEKIEESAISSDNKRTTSNEITALLEKITTVESLREIVMKFDGCQLKAGAKNTVFADGSPQSSIMIIGEAPGENEDKHGIPFCGESGALLEHILKSVALKRQDVYITNAVFYRPPSNRKPTLEEIDTCRPFVQKHIALVKPPLILLMGATAVESILYYKGALTPIHGKVIPYGKKYNEYITDDEVKINAVPLFHPSYMLRQSLSKKVVWNVLRKIKLEILK